MGGLGKVGWAGWLGVSSGSSRFPHGSSRFLMVPAVWLSYFELPGLDFNNFQHPAHPPGWTGWAGLYGWAWLGWAC